MAALKSRYFRHRCYRCFLHSVSSVTINEVTDQSAAVVDAAAAAAVAAATSLAACLPAADPIAMDSAANRFPRRPWLAGAARNGTEGVIVPPLKNGAFRATYPWPETQR